MKSYTTLLFDADGTLFDFKKSEQKALKETFARYNYPMNEAIMEYYQKLNQVLWQEYELGHKTREEVVYTRFGNLFQQIGIEDDGIVFEDVYQKALGRKHDLIENAMEVIQKLACHFTLYIVSNGVVDTQYQRLDESGLRPYFEDIFISEELGYQKPKREYFDCCFTRIKEKNKEQILMIGDSLASDMIGGINAGIDTCWFNPERKTKNKELILTYEIKELTQLYKILGKDE